MQKLDWNTIKNTKLFYFSAILLISLISVTQIYANLVFPYLYGRNVDVHGYVDPRFYSLKQAFR